MTVATFVAAILKQMRDISKPQQKFLIHILGLYLSIRGRINFSQMSRYGTYNEGTYHNQFKEHFDFINFNKNLIKRAGSGEYLLVFDPTHLPKSGSKTPEVGKFWSSCASQMKKGLEFGIFGLIDVHQKTCYHWYANQTPSPATLKEDLDQTLLVYYSCLVKNMSSKVKEMTKYLVVDAYFSKKYFIDKVLNTSHLHIISRLRRDAKLRYLYQGEQKQRGRPRRYAGTIDFENLDLNYFKLVSSNAEERIYEAVVNYPAFGRDLKIAFVESLDEAGNRKSYRIYFSTDLSLDALTIVHYYRLRFQVEFEIRDAKQFTGLTECQSTDYDKLNFHVNLSLTTVSVAKAVYWSDNTLEATRVPFSMADVKSLNFNQLFAEKILALSPEAADLIKKNPEFHNLLKLGVFNYQEAA
jgi:hypothetical protein